MLLKDVEYFVETTREKFKNATKRNPCPICGKTGCGVNSKIVLCWRVQTGSQEQVKSGAFLHFRDSYNYIPTVPSKPVKPKAAPALIAQVYDALLSCLVLTDKHLAALKARGLDEAAILKNNYRSLPTKVDGQIVCKYLSGLYNLDYIPGFYQDATRRLHVQGSGIFIPYRDVNGLIRGMQIRPDKSVTKYFWFSSSDLYKGASSGSHVHLARPELARERKELYVTEGGLKADCIAHLGNVGVAAMGGVTAVNYEDLVTEIKQSLPEVERIVLAFDIDWKHNIHVKDALMKLYETVNKSFQVEIEDWSAKLGKGLDDKLLKEKNENNGKPE